jgi:uncharacterized protein (DUF58 family)
MSLRSTKRANALVLLASASIALGLIFPSEIPFLYAGLALIAYYYVVRYILITKGKALNSLSVERLHRVTVQEKSDVEIKLSLVNRTSLNLNLEVIDIYPQLFRLKEGTNSFIATIPARGFTEVSYILRPTSIGAHEFGKTELILRDPMSLFFFQRTVQKEDMIFVAPSEREISKGALVSLASSIYGGGLFSRTKGEGFEFAELREYVYGDPFRSIEWSATARSNKLMVKQNYSENPLNVMIILECNETMAYGEAGMTKLDYACRAVASLVGYVYRRGDFMGITFMKGSSDPFVVPLSRGMEQARRIIRELSRIKVERGKSDLELALKYSLVFGNVKGKTLFVVISDLNSEKDIAPLRELVAMKHEVVVISPYTPLFESHGLKGVEKALYSINVAYQYRTREKLIRQATKLGIPVLDVGPNDMFDKIIWKVENLRSRGGS